MGILGDVLAGLALPGDIASSLVASLGSDSSNLNGPGCVVQTPPATTPTSPASDSAWAKAEQQESVITQNCAQALDDLKNNKDPTPHVTAAAQTTQQAFHELDQDFEQQYAIASQSQNAQQRAVATQQMCNDLQLAQNIIQNQHAFQQQLALATYTLAQQHKAVPGGGTQGAGLTPAQQATLQNQLAMGGMSPLSGLSQNGASSSASSNPMSSMMSMLPMMAMPAMMAPAMIPSMISGMAGRQPTPGTPQGADAAGATSPDGGLQTQDVSAIGADDVDDGGQTQPVADAHTQPASSVESVGNSQPVATNAQPAAAQAALNGTTLEEAYQQPGMATLPPRTQVVGPVMPGRSAARRRRGVDRPSDNDDR